MANTMHASNVYEQRHAHQRQMMAMMGIDLWALRQQHVQSNTLSIFRDQFAMDAASFEVSSQAALPSSSNFIQSGTDHTANIGLAGHHAVPDENRNSTAGIVLTPLSQPIMMSTDTHAVAVPVDTQAQIPEVVAEVAAFELHACIFEHVVVLVNVQHLTADEAQLWVNIRASQTSQLRALNWPSPVQHFQDGYGVAAYIRGFLEALGSGLKIICLGACSHMDSSSMVQLASLTEMINQPQLKRDLWQAIRTGLQ